MDHRRYKGEKGETNLSHWVAHMKPKLVEAVKKHNPLILNITHVQAYEAAIDALGEKGVMVLIDVSMPMWCCDNNDQNGFFGDRHFHPCEMASSYYYREGTVGAGEPYAVMDYDRKNFRDPKFPEKFQLIQKKVQNPSSNLSNSYMMFHPLTGKCAHVNKSNNELVLGDCKSHNQWSSDGNGSPIRLMDSAVCKGRR
ncbi:hypothetical protein KIW84_072780 [Lathyrus oleraceus]|uniref:Uncharacterized protein n=1 Tax=Pisum sativum TaxID=3888 RepID=A0A9D4VLX8_PEA|nr:hypothetical protein KIW84_072780 [Pisum sativum]